MDGQLFTLNINHLDSLSAEAKKEALPALESGQVIYCPSYHFSLNPQEEKGLLSETILDGHHKNISFNYTRQRLGGFKADMDADFKVMLQAFMQRYANYAHELVIKMIPGYEHALRWGRTSYRPAEIKGRVSSKRKDDTRVHVDAFPATPVNGMRILRVFCNINPYGEPRVWHLGEPYEAVFARFAPMVPQYSVAKAKLLALLGITKTLRTAYDHYQLHLHDLMKLSDNYQCSIEKQQVDFAAQSTWIVFTDQVSHAALSGQFLLEQTFYLPVSAMANPGSSPLHCWEKAKGKAIAMT